MSDYRYLVQLLREFLSKEKSKVINTILTNMDQESTNALRQRHEQIVVIEKELDSIIEKVKKMED